VAASALRNFPSAPHYSRGEEIAHVVTHGLGLALSVVGLVVLLAAGPRGDGWSVVSSVVYGTTLVVLYAGSTLYHAARVPRWRHLAQVIDHATIYLLIAGTYTPFTLVTLRGPWGWTIFGLVWVLAVFGVAREVWWKGRPKGLSLVLYLGMGWIIVFALKPLLHSLRPRGVWLLVAGGLSYTVGTAFYRLERIRYTHAVWHVFVLAGSACHFLAVLLYVVPR
jgi:hemolysin III